MKFEKAGINMIVNETVKSIMSRYSCRAFSSEPVDREAVETVLEAGKHAASGRNAQGWHFTVVTTPEGFALAKAALGTQPPEGYPAHMKWPDDTLQLDAPVLILISGDPNTPYADCGYHMAAGNMMVAASSLGLATVWSTAFTNDCFRDEASAALRQKLIPEGYRIYAALYLGHAAAPGGQQKPRREGVVTWL